MIEFPKMLYRGGDAEAEHKVVFDEAEEDAAREEGFAMVGEAQSEEVPKPRRGRPPKASDE